MRAQGRPSISHLLASPMVGLAACLLVAGCRSATKTPPRLPDVVGDPAGITVTVRLAGDRYTMESGDDQTLCGLSTAFREEVAVAVRRNLPDACKLCERGAYSFTLLLQNDHARSRATVERVFPTTRAGNVGDQKATSPLTALLSMTVLPALPFSTNRCALEITIRQW